MRTHCDLGCTGGLYLRTFWTFSPPSLVTGAAVVMHQAAHPGVQYRNIHRGMKHFCTRHFHSVTTTLTPSPLSYFVKMDHFKLVFDAVGSTRAPKSSLISHNQTGLITFSHVLHAQPASHSGTPNEVYQEVSETARRKAENTPNTITGTSRTRTEPTGSGFIKWMQFTATTSSNDWSLLPNFCL